jgi:hypothetical protein
MTTIELEVILPIIDVKKRLVNRDTERNVKKKVEIKGSTVVLSRMKASMRRLKRFTPSKERGIQNAKNTIPRTITRNSGLILQCTIKRKLTVIDNR